MLIHGLSRLAANALGPNVKEEVDTNEGPQTLAVVLQYQGVVNLAGVTAYQKPAVFSETIESIQKLKETLQRQVLSLCE